MGRGPPEGNGLLVATVDVDPLEQVSDLRHPRRQRRVVEDSVHFAKQGWRLASGCCRRDRSCLHAMWDSHDEYEDEEVPLFEDIDIE